MSTQWRAEGLGCPGPIRFLDAPLIKKFPFRSQKIFLHPCQNNRPFLVVYTIFYSFLSIFLFLLNLTTFFGMPPVILHAQCHNLFISYFLIFLSFTHTV